MELKENGRRRVSWDHNKGGELALNWVARGTKEAQLDTVGLGPVLSEAQFPSVGNSKGFFFIRPVFVKPECF